MESTLNSKSKLSSFSLEKYENFYDSQKIKELEENFFLDKSDYLNENVPKDLDAPPCIKSNKENDEIKEENKEVLSQDNSDINVKNKAPGLILINNKAIKKKDEKNKQDEEDSSSINENEKLDFNSAELSDINSMKKNSQIDNLEESAINGSNEDLLLSRKKIIKIFNIYLSFIDSGKKLTVYLLETFFGESLKNKTIKDIAILLSNMMRNFFHNFHHMGNILGIKCLRCQHPTRSHIAKDYGEWKCLECDENDNICLIDDEATEEKINNIAKYIHELLN